MGWFNHQPICLKNHFPCKDLVHHPMETTFAGVFPKPIGSKMTRDQTPKFPLRNCINHESLLFGIWDGEPLPLGEDQMTKTDHRWPPNVYPQKQWDGVNGAWGWYLKSGQNLWFSSKIPRFRAMILATSLGYLLKRPFWCEFDFFWGDDFCFEILPFWRFIMIFGEKTVVTVGASAWVRCSLFQSSVKQQNVPFIRSSKAAIPMGFTTS